MIEIRYNKIIHNLISNEYENTHLEIFNPIEQQRLKVVISKAVNLISSDSNEKIALDYGCGSGNLTNYLLQNNLTVIAADISEAFLILIKKKYKDSNKVQTLKINGYDLSTIPNNSLDLIAAYSVLHHVPDYLKIVKEMVRVLKKGGIIFLDHECNEAYWSSNTTYTNFCNLASKKAVKSFRRFFQLRTFLRKIILIFNPNYQFEGDIHVYPSDHIEWSQIKEILLGEGCTLLQEEDYLVFKTSYYERIYLDYKNRCTDMKMIIAKK